VARNFASLLLDIEMFYFTLLCATTICNILTGHFLGTYFNGPLCSRLNTYFFIVVLINNIFLLFLEN
jgi:hypothetical protein